MTRDLTQGAPTRLLLGFTIPLILGNVFQQLYGIADTAIVGRILGIDALAAVGSTGSVTYLVLGFVGGLCSGFAIPMAKSFGAGDMGALRRYVANALWLCLFFSAALTVPTLLLTPDILHLTRTPGDIFADAQAYVYVIFAGTPMVFLYGVTSAAMRALGDSRTPLYFLIFSAVLNVGLDFWFILGFDGGVRGAALATVLSQGICGVLSLLALLRRYPEARPRGREWAPGAAYLRRLCWVGLPMGVECSFTAIGSVLLQSSINSLGSAAVAAVTAGSRVSVLLSSPLGYLGVAMATFTGQNLGAKRLDRVRAGLRGSLWSIAVYSAGSFLLFRLFGALALQLFVSPIEAEVFTGAQTFLFWNSLFFLPWGCVILLRCTLQGMGYSLLAMCAGTAEMLARSIVSFTLVPALGLLGACLANPCAWCAALLLLAALYRFLMPRVEFKIRNERNAEAQGM